MDQNEMSNLQRTFHRCFLPTFISFGQAVSEEQLFQKSTNQKQELPMTAMFINGSKRNEQFHRGPSIDASYHVSVQLPKLFQSRRFLEIDQSETRIVMFVNGSGQNEHSLQRTFHRYILPSFDSFSKVVSEEKIFQKSTTQKQELSVVTMFVNGSGRNEQS